MMTKAEIKNREHPRFKSNRVVRFLKEDGSEITSISRITNVSRGGLQFISRAPIEPRTMLRMNISGSHNYHPLSLKAQIVWINQSHDEKGVYYSGVSFKDVDDDVRSVIVKTLVEPSSALSNSSQG
jgi:O-glycosyl hydrolase